MLGDEEQVKYWQEQMINGKVLIGYAQTEVGHGSNLKGLETRANYDAKTE